jgi:hypothetical protein
MYIRSSIIHIPIFTPSTKVDKVHLTSSDKEVEGLLLTGGVTSLITTYLDPFKRVLGLSQ